MRSSSQGDHGCVLGFCKYGWSTLRSGPKHDQASPWLVYRLSTRWKTSASSHLVTSPRLSFSGGRGSPELTSEARNSLAFNNYAFSSVLLVLPALIQVLSTFPTNLNFLQGFEFWHNQFDSLVLSWFWNIRAQVSWHSSKYYIIYSSFFIL